jgi:hypothetical protein
MANASGPIPKRSEDRIRRNKPGSENSTGIVGITKGEAMGGKPFPCPGDWHPLAKKWYRSLNQSGMKAYMEQSDWAQALIIGNELSVYLYSGVVTFTDSNGEEKTYIKRNGQVLTALLNGMASLGATEGERRRMRIELEKPKLQEVPASLTAIENYKGRLGVK